MFCLPHIAIALTLIALAAGCWVMSWGQAPGATEGCKKKANIFGGIIVVISSLSLICLLYMTIASCCGQKGGFWKRGCHYSAPLDSGDGAEAVKP